MNRPRECGWNEISRKWDIVRQRPKTGAEAWKLFQSGEFPLVLTDWMMPHMDGLELVQRIRESNQGGYTYIIMLTAKNETSEIVQGMEAGADDFITKPFDRNELRVRIRAGERIVRLENSLAKHNRRMKADLDAAADLQRSLLPSAGPHVEGAQFAWTFRPCDELAGDILGVFKLADHHVGFYVADVSGHGVAASLLSVSISRMMNPAPSSSSLLVQQVAGQAVDTIVPPARVLRELNRRFQMEESGGRFFSMAYGILDVRTRVLQLASAGHPFIIRVSRDDAVDHLNAEGIVVGVMDDYEYDNFEVQLKSGDRLIAYSDGVVEQPNAHGEAFGAERLQAEIVKSRSSPLEKCVHSIEQEVINWSCDGNLSDDLSIIAIEIQ